MTETKHIPVLLQETIEALAISGGDTVVDATFGGGGHGAEMLRRVVSSDKTGRVIGLDADKAALQNFRERAKLDPLLSQALADQTLVLAHKNYSSLGEVLSEEGVTTCDAILADLGFSSDQIEASERGFSFLMSGPLDMRLNQETELTAEKIVNTFSPEELSRIFREYGDESESWRLAQAIERAREVKPFATTDELCQVIVESYPKGKRYRMKIHPATKVFQALRIAVNQEFEHLEKFLETSVERLRSGGRLAVITFHSGEDTRVKRFFKSKATGCICPPTFPICRCENRALVKILTKKPIVPGEEELRENPRSRSAKLRVVEKL